MLHSPHIFCFFCVNLVSCGAASIPRVQPRCRALHRIVTPVIGLVEPGPSQSAGSAKIHFRIPGSLVQLISSLFSLSTLLHFAARFFQLSDVIRDVILQENSRITQAAPSGRCAQIEASTVREIVPRSDP